MVPLLLFYTFCLLFHLNLAFIDLLHAYLYTFVAIAQEVAFNSSLCWYFGPRGHKLSHFLRPALPMTNSIPPPTPLPIPWEKVVPSDLQQLLCTSSFSQPVFHLLDFAHHAITKILMNKYVQEWYFSHVSSTLNNSSRMIILTHWSFVVNRLQQRQK